MHKHKKVLQTPTNTTCILNTDEPQTQCELTNPVIPAQRAINKHMHNFFVDQPEREMIPMIPIKSVMSTNPTMSVTPCFAILAKPKQDKAAKP